MRWVISKTSLQAQKEPKKEEGKKQMRYNLIFILQQTIVEDAARRQQKCILYASKCVKNTRKTTENRQIEE